MKFEFLKHTWNDGNEFWWLNFRVALDQGEERGWYSYLDMSTLLENLMFQNFLTKYVKNMGKV
jgi:hypothetical protein